MKIKRYSVLIGKRKTSISLEPEFFEAAKALARRKGKSFIALVSEIDAGCILGSNLSSEIRLYVLADMQRRLEA
ncbi:ribbon-helix-helix domain-containing protein [Ancylobacter sp. Lp-2]|uniref:ribbon-helix-helix domain-containing protein n=1 Tax=Ancylobacter sp. Lp-2 TaxID=2881339 RepID=UPI001E4FC3BF|nr:ribbon-helix-helix domain-containing protein [Ancylobacter sp. Lp-2]MCB4771795.1 ribbon-helix-helix domain-containing protein [Ancylobacter sp. Lp-2]